MTGHRHVAHGHSPTLPPSSDSVVSAWQAKLSSWWNYTTASFTSYSQLPQSNEDQDMHTDQLDPEMEALRLSKARRRTYWLAAVLCCGGALFGYDSGVIGGVLTFPSFQTSFAFTESQKTRVSAIAVGIQQAGALAGCFIIWPVTNRLGRRLAMMLCSLIFCIGVVFEIIDSQGLLLFYIGRVICGLGVGGSATVIPIYMSEMSPKEIRGQLGSCYQLTYTIGILASYWIDYGVKQMPASAVQWQLPIGLQLVPGALMGLGMLTLDESVRWLLAHGKTSEAWHSLVWIRAGTSQAVTDEFAEMQRGLEEERHATAGFRTSELLEGPNLHRLLIAGGLFLAQQSTGATALAYFGPQFFSLLVGPGDKNLLLTGIFGAIKVASCLFFVVYMSERFGRRPLLAAGTVFMGICMLATAGVVKNYPPQDGVVTTAGIVTVALIYLDIIAYNLSFGPLCWPICGEIFPTRIREPGVAFGVGSQWFFNFVWSFATPYIMAGIGWGTFLLFGIFDVFVLGFVVLCLKETAGKTLEEINALFEPVGADAEAGWKDVGDVDENEHDDEDHMEQTPSQHQNGFGQDRYMDDAGPDGDKHPASHVESTAGRA